MGDRNVTVIFIGPAVITYIDLVGVICTFVTGIVKLELLRGASTPSQEYEILSTLMLPAHPMIDYNAY